jgi:uncharacterized protein YegL
VGRSDTEPDGFTIFSPQWSVEPSDAELTLPAVVGIRFETPNEVDADAAVVFWSRRTGDGGGFERLGGVIDEDGYLQSEITQFGSGFVADGVLYEDPPDRSCVQMELLQGVPISVLIPDSGSAVGLYFTVDDCQGRPITGLTEADFALREDGDPLSAEASVSILPQRGLQVFTTLLIDMSNSTRPQLAEIIAGAQRYIQTLEQRELPVQVAVDLFAGERGVTRWAGPTLDTQGMIQRLDLLAEYEPEDPGSTNMHGAVIDSLAALDRDQREFIARNNGGAFTKGYIVLFTDGGDTAGYHTAAEVVEARENTLTDLLVVGLQSDDYDITALQALEPNKILTAPTPAALQREFGALANQIAGQVRRIYLLGYCSPSRNAEHIVEVRLADAQEGNSLEYTFDATGFSGGCSESFFESICADKECGGLYCGFCDERQATCVDTTCVSFNDAEDCDPTTDEGCICTDSNGQSCDPNDGDEDCTCTIVGSNNGANNGQSLVYRFVAVEDLTSPGSGSAEFPGADVDAISVNNAGGEFFATYVENFEIDPRGNSGSDPNELLGAPDANCEANSGAFTALGGVGNYVIVSFGTQSEDVTIENGNSIKVYELGSTLCGRFDDDPYRVSVSVSDDLGSFIFIGDGGQGSNEVPVSGLP